MPYVSNPERQMQAEGRRPVSAGGLNYAITKYLIDFGDDTSYEDLEAGVRAYIDQYIVDMFQDVVTYATIHSVMGTLCCIMHEVVRRDTAVEYDWIFDLIDSVMHDWYDQVAAPYEDLAIARNGDIFP